MVENKSSKAVKLFSDNLPNICYGSALGFHLFFLSLIQTEHLLGARSNDMFKQILRAIDREGKLKP